MELIKIDDYRWEIPQTGGMRVPGRIFASETLIRHVISERAPEQVANVAHLPGIVGQSLAMPDIHWGYGFPIGGVAAFDATDGIISPGGVGYDINCGVRLLTTTLMRHEVKSRIRDVIRGFSKAIPSGVGSRSNVRLTKRDEHRVLREGASWAVEQGFGVPEDLEYTEENGCISGADPSELSPRALERGRPQLGTLGSGNHFVEVAYVEEVFDPEAASLMGLDKERVTVTVHSGSRGLGYQVCDDFIRVMVRAAAAYGIVLPDRQLCCAPVRSPEGASYLRAMWAAVNYAFANRQIMAHRVRSTLARLFGQDPASISTVYEVAHNIAKIEKHEVEGNLKALCVHRKGATRAFGPGRPEVPEKYRRHGQPVLVPGDMGTRSYVLLGSAGAMRESFGSACHGAGRMLSRKKAIQHSHGRSIAAELAKEGIFVMATGRRTLQEEMPDAYKDVSSVVDAITGAGLGTRVARLRPLGCLKG
jgi:tRNA-splicing ligase RtcB